MGSSDRGFGWLRTQRFARALDLGRSDDEFEEWVKEGWKKDKTQPADDWTQSQEKVSMGNTQAARDAWIQRQLAISPAVLPTLSIGPTEGGIDLDTVIPPSAAWHPANPPRAGTPTALIPHEPFTPDLGIRISQIATNNMRKPLIVRNCTIGRLEMTHSVGLLANDCQIGTLHVSGGQADIRLTRCRIGELRADSDSVGQLLIDDSRVHHFTLTPLSMKDVRPAILGNIKIDRCSFPVRRSEIFRDRVESYTGLRGYLEQLDNANGTHQLRGIEGAAQFHEERGVFKFVSALHRAFSGFGLNPGRPLIWITSLWLLLALITYGVDGARPADSQETFFKYCMASPEHRSQEDRAKLGWEAALCKDKVWSRVKRSALLPAQHLLNPLGLLHREELLEARTLWLRIALFGQDIINVIAYFYFFFAIRRRFRM